MAAGSIPPGTQDELLIRRSRLREALRATPADRQLGRLMTEVDAALDRIERGTYGICETCHEPIEAERLAVDPLLRFCLDHLTPAQQQALEEDLALAARIQSRLLPDRRLRTRDWDVAFHYQGAGPVSGDYCDLLGVERSLYFVVGDVSGKGIAAAMLMANLQATLRALIGQDLPLERIMERTSRLFCESTLPTHFATLACGKAEPSGEVSICLAGHPPALCALGDEIGNIEATGLPLGMFCEERFGVARVRLAPGDTVLLFTDGVSEAIDAAEREYGTVRLADLLRAHREADPAAILSACVEDLRAHQAGVPPSDDQTIMVVRRL